MLRGKARQDVYRPVFASDGDFFRCLSPPHFAHRIVRPQTRTANPSPSKPRLRDTRHTACALVTDQAGCARARNVAFSGSCIADATPARHCSASGYWLHLHTTFRTPTLSRRLLPRIRKLSPFQSLVKVQCSASRLRIVMVHLKIARALISICFKVVLRLDTSLRALLTSI